MLPPIYHRGGGFSVSEPYTHDQGREGSPVYATFVELGPEHARRYFATYCTVREVPFLRADLIAAVYGSIGAGVAANP